MPTGDHILAAPVVPKREVPETIERLKAMRCIAAVAERGSTTRGAEVVHLSQPAVTRSILDLEQHIGQTLFERGASGMAPTPLGARVALRAARLQQLLALGAEEALQLSVSPPRRAPLPQRFAAAVSWVRIRLRKWMRRSCSATNWRSSHGRAIPAWKTGRLAWTNCSGGRG